MWCFVNKLAESFLFYVFPLVFSRKSIIFVAKLRHEVVQIIVL